MEKLGASVLATLATLMANPITFAIVLAGIAIWFLIGFVTLALLGLVTAVIFAVVAVGIIWLLGLVNKNFLKNHPLIIMIVPLFFIVGYISDHVPALGLSLLPAIDRTVILAQQDFLGGTVAIYGPYAVAFVALMVAVASLIVSWAIRNKYWWVGRRKHR
jgi:hypothetical protein